MSKRVRTLVITGVAIVCLVGLLLILLFSGGDNGITNSTSTTTNGDDTIEDIYVLNKKDVDDSKKIPTVSIATIRLPDETISFTANADGDLLMDGYADFIHDSDATGRLRSSLLQLRATRIIAESTDVPEQYGFTSEGGVTATVSATYSDGSNEAFDIGAAAPGNEGYYVRRNNDKTVYLITESDAARFVKTAFDFLSKAPITVPEPENTTDSSITDIVVLRDVELSGSVRPTAIYYQGVLENTDTASLSALSGYVIQRPYYHGVKTDSEFINYTTFVFTADTIVKLNLTANDLETYGLDDPYSAATFRFAVRREKTTTDEEGKESSTFSYYNTFEYTVKLGNRSADGYRYAAVYSEGKLLPVLYSVKDKTVAWQEVQYTDLVDILLFLMDIKNVGSASFTVDGVTTDFVFKHSTDSDDAPVLDIYQGSKQKDAQAFRELYQDLMAIYRIEGSPEEPTGEAVFSFTFKSNTTSATDVNVTFYKHTASRYIVKHGNGELLYVRVRDADEVFEAYRDWIS